MTLGHVRLLFHCNAEHHMGMPAAHANWTIEMLDALPDDGQRYEIIDGELYVTPAPTLAHQLVAGAFYRRIDPYLRTGSLARAVCSPADVRRDDRTRNRVQPDVFAFRLVEGKPPAYPFSLNDLVLALEVESPSNSLHDHHVKRALYLANGVAEYWIASAEARIVTRWRSLDDPGEVFGKQVTWRPDGMSSALVIDLPTLFGEALD